MEMEEIQTQGRSKFPRISNGNGRIDSSPKIAPAQDDDDDGDVKRRNGGGGGGLNIGGVGSLCGWPSSSRIVRVSRASGGKDRHSKVLTSKGLRDRRVRLSVNTAIQFYDLQDRLGYDQPSKAVEWLLKAAAPSISELPSLNPPFSEISDERKSSAAVDSADIEMEGDHNIQQQQHHGSLSKSCSSTSETSKGSGGLSLSRSECRIKARERARERTAEKEKEKENESSRGGCAAAHHHQISSSFTELLTGTSSPNNGSSSIRGGDTNFFAKSPMDYFTTGLITRPMDHSSSAYPHLTTNNPLHSPMFNMGGGGAEHFSFVPDHLAPVVSAAGAGAGNNNNEYNLNFSISPSSSSSTGLAGFNNRGTLQSNSSSPSLMPHFQRFPPLDGSSSPASFFTIAAPPDNNHHFLPRFDARLHLYGDAHGGSRHSDHKGKGKN